MQGNPLHTLSTVCRTHSPSSYSQNKALHFLSAVNIKFKVAKLKKKKKKKKNLKFVFEKKVLWIPRRAEARGGDSRAEAGGTVH